MIKYFAYNLLIKSKSVGEYFLKIRKKISHQSFKKARNQIFIFNVNKKKASVY